MVVSIYRELHGCLDGGKVIPLQTHSGLNCQRLAELFSALQNSLGLIWNQAEEICRENYADGQQRQSKAHTPCG
jgi:hypothetical protein